MGLVKTRRLAAMQKQQRAKAGMKPPVKRGGVMVCDVVRSHGALTPWCPQVANRQYNNVIMKCHGNREVEMDSGRMEGQPWARTYIQHGNYRWTQL